MLKGGQVMCTSVVACLSSGFAEIKEIVSIFVNFHKFFGYFESSAFFQKMGSQTSHKISQAGCLQSIFKITTIKSIFKKRNCGYLILRTKWGQT